MLDGAQFIYCADAGLGSYNIRKFNSMGGRAFFDSWILYIYIQLQGKPVMGDQSGIHA